MKGITVPRVMLWAINLLALQAISPHSTVVGDVRCAAQPIAGDVIHMIGSSMPLDACSKAQAQQILQNSMAVKGPYTFELLSGGFSGSEIYKVTAAGKSYVVRFWNMQWADYFQQDLECQLIASEAGYGPKVYYCDEVQGVTVMDYYLPEPLPELQTRLQAIVDLLKKIHDGPIVPKGVDRDVYIDSLIEELNTIRLFDLEAIRTIKNTVYFATRPNAACTACHRDLHHGNLIYTQGTFFAIDYTWGALDDPYTDLANVSIFNCRTESDDRLLLQLYLGRPPNDDEMARLSLMKLPVKIFYGLECLGIAFNLLNGELSPQTPSKTYMQIGVPGSPAPSPLDILVYAYSFLSEVFDYSRSSQYQADLDEISGCLFIPQ